MGSERREGGRGSNGFGGVEAVERALALLRVFEDGGTGFALRDLSARSGLSKSTILRLAASLERFGYLVRDDDGLYHLGSTLWRLGSIFRQNLDLGQSVRPVLKSLVESTGESASFYVRRGDVGVCLYRANSGRLARDHIEEGEVLPLGLGASGHVLERYGDPDCTVMAPGTTPDDVYVSLGERDPEIAGMSAPVFSPERELVGAISLSGLLSRFTPDKVATYRSLLANAAADIEARMGAQKSRD